MATVGASTREWTFGRTLWFSVVVIGWLVVAYIALTVPDGLYAMADWVGSLNPVVQVLVWLVLLPYMMAMWVWNSTWELWMRVLGVGALVLVTVLASRPRVR
jgi:hypothetical protein